MKPSSRALGLLAPAIAIAPFFALAAFAQPQNDDWWFGATSLRFGFRGANLFWYEVWTGRYLSTAVVSGSPIGMGTLTGHAAVLAAILAIFVAGAVALAFACLPGDLSRATRAGAGLSLAAVHLATMPSIAEGVYWLSGSATYLLGCALLTWTVALSVATDRLGGWRRSVALAGAVLAAALCAGTNEIALAFLVAFTVAHLAWSSVRGRRVRWDLLAVAAVALAGGAVVLLAPGNEARLRATHVPAFSTAVALWGAEAFRYVLAWLTGPLLPAACAVAVVLPARTAWGDGLPRARWVLAATFAATLAAIAVPVFTTGLLETRTANEVNWFFVTGVFVSALALRARIVGALPRALGNGTAALALVALAFALGMLRPTSFRSAVVDLASGEAWRYAAEVEQRYLRVSTCPIEICEVPPLENMPRSLYWFDDALDESHDSQFMHDYKDGGFAFWCGKERVRLGPPPQSRHSSAD